MVFLGIVKQFIQFAREEGANRWRGSEAIK